MCKSCDHYVHLDCLGEKERRGNLGDVICDVCREAEGVRQSLSLDANVALPKAKSSTMINLSSMRERQLEAEVVDLKKQLQQLLAIVNNGYFASTDGQRCDRAGRKFSDYRWVIEQCKLERHDWFKSVPGCRDEIDQMRALDKGTSGVPQRC